MFGANAPDPWLMASDEQRALGEINDDLCVLPLDGQTHYFVRGHIEIPVDDPTIRTFSWSVWASLSEANFDATIEHWNAPDRAALAPMFGWLCTWLVPYDPPTTGLQVSVRTREPGVVPLIELQHCDHTLAREQAHGISLHRVAELNSTLLGE